MATPLTTCDVAAYESAMRRRLSAGTPDAQYLRKALQALKSGKILGRASKMGAHKKQRGDVLLQLMREID